MTSNIPYMLITSKDKKKWSLRRVTDVGLVEFYKENIGKTHTVTTWKSIVNFINDEGCNHHVWNFDILTKEEAFLEML